MIAHATDRVNVRAALNALRLAAVCCSLVWASAFCAEMSSGKAEYLITTWHVEDGLPNNSVSAITQTPDGYLWLATFGGLARFDGVRFEVFGPQNTPALKSGKVLGLFLDRQGDLLIATQAGGLVRRHAGQFTCLDTGWDAINPIHTWVEEPEGRWWATLHSATPERKIFQFADGRWHSLPFDSQLAGRIALQLACETSGQLWLATEKELAFQTNGRFQRLNLGSLELDPEQPLLASPRGGLWVAANGRVRKLKDGRWTSDLGPHPWGRRPLTAQHEDREGNLWVGTFGEGLFCFPAGGGPCRHVTTADGLSHNRIRSIFEDREGNLWVGTEGGGLNRLRERIFYSVHHQQRLLDMPVWSVTTGIDGSVCWSTEFNGVYGLRGGQLWHDPPALLPAALRETALPAPAKAGAICEDRSGTVWLGAYPAGLMKKVNGRYEMVADTGRTHPRIRVLFEDRQGGLWAGAESGLLLMRGETVREFTTREGLWSDSIQALAETQDGTLWVGTTGGLNRYTNGLFTRQIDQAEMPRNPVGALHCDAEGVLWMGTDSGDLAWLQAGRFSPCPANPGGPSGPINHIATDDFDGLWIAVNRGIFRASRQQLLNVARRPEETIAWLEFGRSQKVSFFDIRAQPAGCKTPDGRLWFATVNGVVAVDPRRVQRNELAPPVILETMLVDGAPVSLESGQSSPSTMARPAIGPGRNQFEFRYTALSFAEPAKVLFRYKLEGLDHEWVEAGTRRTANYGHVPAGAYRFRVRACNNDGVWNDAGASLAFTVLPSFHQTWWFITILTVSAVGLVAGTVRIVSVRRYRRKVERLRHQHAMERERGRIAQDIHDDLGASLTHIQLLGELVEGEATLPGVLTHTRKIRHTAREMVQALDEIVWAVSPQNDTLESLVDYLDRAADEFFENTRVSCRHSLSGPVPASKLSAEVRHNLFLAFREAVNNVLKHAEATEVRIDMAVEASRLRITITDNGKGFDPAAGRPGRHGLDNLRHRLAGIGDHCEISSQLGAGTKVVMEITTDTPKER